LGQLEDSATDDYGYGVATASKNKITITLQLSGSDFVEPDSSYTATGATTASPTSSVTNFPAMRTYPFAPNMDSASDDGEIIFNIYGA